MMGTTKWVKWAVAGAAVFVLAVLIAGTSGCSSTPEAGEVGVVRNGSSLWPLDWFDNKNIRGHVENGSGTSWIGLGSEVHYYPVSSQQRFIKMHSCYGTGAEGCDADAAAVTVPTSDGVEATIEGTIYLNTVFDNSRAGLAAADAFDTQFATRQFGGHHAYEGTEGWSAFLTAIVVPIVQNNLRESISGTPCADLVSSCALVQNTGGDKETAEELLERTNNRGTVADVQTAVGTALAVDLRETLGDREYFGNIAFRLTRVGLPEKIQNGIDDAQAAFAQVSQAQARVASATADAEANEERQRGYNRCPACREIDAIKAWAGTGVTTVVTGGASVAVGGR